MKKQIFLLSAVAVLFTACSSKNSSFDGGYSPSYEHKQKTIHYSNRSFPPYPKISNNTRMLNLEFAQTTQILPAVEHPLQKDRSAFVNRYFKVWNQDSIKTSAKNATWGVRGYKNTSSKTYYKPDGSAYSDAYFDSVEDNANVEAFKSVSRFGVTTKNTFLRNAPSNNLLFKSLSKPGEGYPFDHYANSTLAVNYPVYISHYTKDKKFALVQNDAVWGWIKSSDLKTMSPEEMSEFENSNFLTILQDDSPLKDMSGNKILNARVGSILRMTGEDANNLYGEIYTKNGKKKFMISKQYASKWPAKFDTQNVKKTIQSILGEPYGWGGFDYYRDCSLFTKDVMANFGFWLPRNSKAQAKMYNSISLRGKSNAEKLSIIRNEGVPYRTLLFLPGHIMLYSGIVDNQVTAVHNAWGLKTTSGGRALIGQTAITTLEIGKDEADIDENKLLLPRIVYMTVVE